MEGTPAARNFKHACSVFLKDLEALPEEAFCRKFGPATRTVADIVFEVNMVNDHAGGVMKDGKVPFDWPENAGWIHATPEFCAKEVIVDAFQKSTQPLIDAAMSYSEENMQAKVMDDSGETTREAKCRFMTLHLWYHSGQLNFIQTLLGDTEWHWK
ncbi:MAG TPA: hypothetical protein VG944_06010 [Fimbriimonas sp.]|nr:hypothetical protein [Fimbriimonas sp.]